MDLNVNINADCIEAMRSLDDECVDLVVVDPPYWKVVWM